MFKLFISLFVLSTFSNASFHSVDALHSTIAEVPDSHHCYSRTVSADKTFYYEAKNLYESNEVSYYCFNRYKTTPSSTLINADICNGPSVSSLEEGVPQGGSVTLHRKSWYFTLKLCSAINTMPAWCEPVLDSNNNPMSLDSDCNPVVYVDGIPYEATTIENARYFNSYTDELVCNQTFLAISDNSCIQPNYEERNIADAILKRDKIAKDNNFTDVSGITPENITYNDNGSIQSFSFTAKGSDGSIQSIYTEFNEDDPVFTVEEDGTITESEYVPNNDTGTGGSTGDTGTGGSTGNTGTGGSTGGTGNTGTIEDIAHQSLLIADSVHNISKQGNVTNEHLDNIEFNISQINEALSPDLNQSVITDIAEMTNDSNSIIDEAKQAIQNIQDGYTNIKNNIDELNNFLDEKTNNQAQLTIKNNLELEKKEINMFGNSVSMNCFFNQDLYELFAGIRPLITFLLNIVFAVITIKMWLKAFRFASGNL